MKQEPNLLEAGGAAQFVTALVCTCNRGDSLIKTVSSILANVYPNFELLVVDQSTDEETALAIKPFLQDTRLRYLRQNVPGKALSLNFGLTEARGEVVAITDDDCEVPGHWLGTMAKVFADHPKVAVAFCNVEPASHDALLGFIPAYQRSSTKLLTCSLDKCRARGIGAGIAVRRESVLALGGFDSLLGPGGRFPSCDDGDIAVRSLLLGYHVYETDAVAVAHSGFRTWQEGKNLAWRDWVAIGAAYAKPIKCGHWRFAVVPLFELTRFALWPPIWDLLHLRRPRGVGRIAAFLQGFMQGWQIPVDPKTLLFR